jgi:hypothetical protein
MSEVLVAFTEEAEELFQSINQTLLQAETSKTLDKAFMPDYPSLNEEQSKEVTLDTNDFIKEQQKIIKNQEEYIKKLEKSSKEGWEKTEGVRNFDALPDTAKSYIEALEKMIGTKMGIISTSPDRKDTIIR